MPKSPERKNPVQPTQRSAWCGAASIFVSAFGAAGAWAGTTVINHPGEGRNRIEVSGNQASGVQVDCAAAAAGTTGRNPAPAQVNSVNIDGQSLRGQTVVVTGRNTQNVRVPADCAKGAGKAGDGTQPAAQVNSINIR